MNEENTKKSSGRTSLFLILFVTIIFFITPVPKILFSLIPDSVIARALSPIYQDIELSSAPTTITKPQKLTHEKLLPVLGHNTGICFTFSGDLDKELKHAARGKVIAEIIALTPDKKEYILDETTLNKTDNGSSIICQKFSRNHSLVPDQIKAVYVRPLKPFTPDKITWATVKKMR